MCVCYLVYSDLKLGGYKIMSKKITPVLVYKTHNYIKTCINIKVYGLDYKPRLE